MYLCAVIIAHHKLDDQIGAIVRVDIYLQSLFPYVICQMFYVEYLKTIMYKFYVIKSKSF